VILVLQLFIPQFELSLVPVFQQYFDRKQTHLLKHHQGIFVS